VATDLLSTAEYLRDMTSHLATMAKGAKFSHCAYLLDMANLEMRQVVENLAEAAKGEKPKS
jgi:hypothetical protein